MSVASQPQPNGILPDALPIKSKQAACLIHDTHTEVLCQLFSDRILVLVTQLGKIGVMLHVSAPSSAAASLSIAQRSSQPEFSNLTHVCISVAVFAGSDSLCRLPAPDPSSVVTTLMGSAPSTHAEHLHELYAAQIGAIVFTQSATSSTNDVPWQGRGVVVGLGLKDLRRGAEADGPIQSDERETFAQVMKLVMEARVW